MQRLKGLLEPEADDGGNPALAILIPPPMKPTL